LTSHLQKRGRPGGPSPRPAEFLDDNGYVPYREDETLRQGRGSPVVVKRRWEGARFAATSLNDREEVSDAF